VTVRDSWDKKDSPLREAFAKLQELIGIPVWCEPEWSALLEELKGAFPDQGSFVPTIANVVEAWATAVTEIAGDDINEAWVEEMLEKVGGRQITLVLGIGKDRPTTFWNDTVKAFEICFPKKVDNARTLSSVMTAGFYNDLRKAFKPQNSSSHQRTRSRPQATVVPDASDESWVDAAASDMDSASIVGLTPAATMHSHSVPSSLPMRFAPAFDQMPTVNSIERPEELTLRPPYHLILRWSESKVLIHGGHQPSLELIAEYLKKWAKRNHTLSNKVYVPRWRFLVLTNCLAPCCCSGTSWLLLWARNNV
jgi:hypothetical protein